MSKKERGKRARKVGERTRERLSKKEGVLESRSEKMKDEKREREIEKEERQRKGE